MAIGWKTKKLKVKKCQEMPKKFQIFDFNIHKGTGIFTPEIFLNKNNKNKKII